VPAFGRVRGTLEDLAQLRASLEPRAAAPAGNVAACRDTIAAAASTYGQVRVDAVAAGAARRNGRGLDLPIEARVLYSSNGITEVRQATVTCRFDTRGQVVALR